jgi:predicted porin
LWCESNALFLFAGGLASTASHVRTARVISTPVISKLPSHVLAFDAWDMSESPIQRKSMKKFATLAVLATLSSMAAAQSNVTLFGVVDEAARYVKNGSNHLYSLASGGINTSRVGFRGIEDLGDGLKAGFWLESGFNADSGSNSDSTRFFNRRSTVSLLGNFGEVRLGRDYTPTYLGYTDYDVFGDNGIAASSKFDLSLGVSRDAQTGVTQYTNSGETRSDNQIQYFTPTNLGGFYGRASVASGEAVAGKKYYGGRVGYGAGPLDVSVSYGQFTVAPVLGDDKFKTFDVGATYDFAVVKLFGYYTQNKLASQKIQTYSLGATAPIGAGLVKAAFTHSNQSGTIGVTTGTGTQAFGTSVDANDADQLAVGYIYNLSKRTAVYGTAAYLKNKGNAQFALSGGPAIGAGQKSKGAEVGLRHAF